MRAARRPIWRHGRNKAAARPADWGDTRLPAEAGGPPRRIWRTGKQKAPGAVVYLPTAPGASFRFYWAGRFPFPFSRLRAGQQERTADFSRMGIFSARYGLYRPAASTSQRNSASASGRPACARFSGCHCTPRIRRCGASSASITPSSARADTAKPGAAVLTA